MLQKCFQLEPYGNLVANAGPEAPAAGAAAGRGRRRRRRRGRARGRARAGGARESALAEAPAVGAAAAPGASNVLAITLFCLDEAHECRARDFFPSVFALFPGRDYCVTAPPTMKASAPFLKDFVAVPSRLGSTFSHTLFLLHRASLVAAEQLRVRRFDPAVHAAPAAALLASRGDDAVTADGEPAPTPDQIVAGLGADFSVPLEEGPNAAAFVAVVGGAVVAVVSVSRKAASTNVLNWLKANYHIEDFVPFERHRARAQASLGLLVVNPIFAAHARFVLKEVMRLYDKTVLYHESALGDRMPPLVLKELVPVRARWRPTPEPGGALLLEHRPKGDDEPPAAAAAAGDDDTATVGSASAARDGPPPRARGELLHYFTRRLASDRKAEVHARVVVVGLSCCAVGLLQELLFEPGLHLSHVTLVSPNGVPDPEHSGASRYEAFDEDFPARFQFEALGLGQRLRVVHARVVDLDRANKAVVLPDGAIVLYDVLVLTNGLQESSAKRLARSAGPDFAGGLALLGDDGVHGDEFGDGEVMRLTEVGVRVLYDLELRRLVHDAETGELESRLRAAAAPAVAGSPPAPPWHDAQRRAQQDMTVDVECGILLGADADDITSDLFLAVNEAGLVYDGRLVVDAQFRTTDKSIYAGGRHTKFSNVHRRAIAARGGGPTALYHERYNSLELGAHLARCVLDRLDPRVDPVEAPPDALPDFGKPRTRRGRGRPEAALGGAVGVRSLRDLAAARDKYSVLKIDKNGVLAEIVYLGREPVEPRNLAALVGNQEAYLNSAWLSYERGIVDDWIAFFRSDWCSALKHDRFADLQRTLADMIDRDEGARDVVSMLLAGLDAGKDDETLRQLRAKAVGVGGSNLPKETRQLLETAVLGYLRKNRTLLPRFLLPEKPHGKASVVAPP
ncbi:hypothetical protein JL722_6922 [Aureococcus anophagefferens]|nr:hypothetical protein JL722_6922 [Aureococcus anophagefferens]